MSTTDRSDRLRELIMDGRDHRIYSAAAWAVGDHERVIVRGYHGTRAWPQYADQEYADQIDAEPLDGSELFDLASVTKPLVAIAIFDLIERGLLDLSSTVGSILHSYASAPVATATVADLLLHTSGLPGRIPLFRRAPTREALLRALGDLPLLTPPGIRVEYSSQGFIVLGLIAEAVGGADLSKIIDGSVARPAGAHQLGFLNPGSDPGAPVVATERCDWRGRMVQGEVHDENAVVLGGAAGHAGLFGTVDDLAAIGRALVGNLDQRRLLAPSTLRVMTESRTADLNLARSYGWQGIDHPNSVAGSLIGPRSFGHTGFTGTSLFVDPDARRWYVLLTNRVHPSRDSTGIAELRRRFHNIASTL